MRVAQVCPYSLTIPGGVQNQVLALARALRALGHETRVLAPCDGPPPDAGVTPLGNSIPFATNGSVAPLAPDVSCALRTIRALRDEDFDVLHLQEPLTPGPTLTSLLFTDPKTRPMIGTFHRSGPSTAYAVAKPMAVKVANRLSLRAAVSKDALATAHDALGGDQGDYELVFNGVEVERFAKAEPYPAKPDGPTVFFIGRHEERKGLDVLIAALDHLPKDTHLWIAGTGPQTEQLKHQTTHKPNVHWLGRISDEEAASRLRAADVFCAPSLHGESFGIVLLEGMAAQTPVVASDLPGYRNVVRPGVDSLLVPPGDPAALAHALTQVLTDSTLANELVTAGEQRANEFSMDRLAERYVGLYERLLSRR